MRITIRYCLALLLVPVALAAMTVNGQVPTGAISGTVQDASGAVISKATVTITNKSTGAERKLETAADGYFNAPLLPAGEYDVKVQATGFRTQVTTYTVLTGSVINGDTSLEVGQTSEIVTVEGTAAQVNFESHTIDGVITRQKIQDLPLNGRSFLQLAFLEPGVSVGAGTTSQYNSLFSVSVLGGSSDKTNITVDGGNVRDPINGNTSMNFSQEVVQEFQLSSNNFDLSTGITSVGSVNIVSRTGSNEFHGSAYMFYRDNHMAAYPGLARNAANPKPFFARRNPGVWVGGPLIKDRLFFFSNYEFTNQSQVFTVQPDLPSVRGLAGNFSSPYRGHLFSTRLDWRISDKNTLFARLSHDRNRGFGPSGGAPLPSNWLQNKNYSIQGVLGLTTTISSTLVNDFRFNTTYWQNRNLFADSTVCQNCLGLGFPQLTLVGSNNFTVGNTSNATQGRDLRRFTFFNNLSWQKGSHRLRFGTELEHAPGTGFWGYCDPACGVAFSPEYVRQVVPAPLVAALFPNLPTVIRTNADLLNLPFAGGVVGIGNPAQPPPYNVDAAKINRRMRWFAQDTWRATSNLTINYGLAWNFESTLVNKDLSKPSLLAPLYGTDLTPTRNNYKNYSPSLGLAWNIDKSKKTVIRAGGGIYWETELLWRRLQERAFIGPVGNGRIQFPHTGFVNTFNGILDIAAGGRPVAVGAPLPANTLTTMTVGQFMQIAGQQGAVVAANLAPKDPNNLAVRNIQLFKSGSQLYPKDYPVQRSYQMSVGIQRELPFNMVLTADFVRRIFVNTLLGELDYNRFNRRINGVQTPVIPRCTSAAQVNDPSANCSSGSITFWTPAGRSVYNALLVKLDKRMSNRFLFTASYALTAQSGYNGIANLDKWNSTWGPQGSRHIINISGIVDLPLGLQLGIISSMATRGPLMPSVTGVDLDGDGTTTEPIIGAKSYNCFNRGCGKSDLSAAVALWNQTYSGKTDARGQNIPQLTLPTDYEFGDNFSSQDIRLTKTFTWKDRYKLSVFGEMFNFLNIANLSGYNFTVNNALFGKPTQRATQVFGSGGPRALQLGARFSF